jgi:hypothetical protein
MVRLIGSLFAAAIIAAVSFYVYYRPRPGDRECEQAIASYFKAPSINVRTREREGDLITVAFDFVGPDGKNQPMNLFSCQMAKQPDGKFTVAKIFPASAK